MTLHRVATLIAAAVLVATAAGCTSDSTEAMLSAAPTYTLPPPEPGVAASVAEFISGPGQPIRSLHHVVAPLLDEYTSNACQAAQQRLVELADDVISAVAAAPDEVLGELAIDELSLLTHLNDCPATADVDQLRRVDRLLTERFNQMGIPQ